MYCNLYIAIINYYHMKHKKKITFQKRITEYWRLNIIFQITYLHQKNLWQYFSLALKGVCCLPSYTALLIQRRQIPPYLFHLIYPWLLFDQVTVYFAKRIELLPNNEVYFRSMGRMNDTIITKHTKS